MKVARGLAHADALQAQWNISRLEQAQDILCSGQLDFVFSQNAASSMIHVARSSQEAPLTEIERIILGVAQPNLQRDALWNVDPSLVSLAQAGQPAVAFESASEARTDSVDVLQFHDESFQKVADITEYTLEEAGGILPCSDSVGGVYPGALKGIVEDSNDRMIECELDTP